MCPYGGPSFTLCFGGFAARGPDGMQALWRAYSDVGVRAGIAPMVADTTLYGAYPGLRDAMPAHWREQAAAIRLAPHEAGAEAMAGIFENWPFDRSRIKPAIAPTIPLHCSAAFLLRCRDLARAYGQIGRASCRARVCQYV